MKKSMKSIVLGFSVMALSLSMLAGCGSKAANDAELSQGEEQGQSSEEPIKIKWWSLHRHEADFMQAWVDKFNEENTDNIEIEYLVQSGNFLQSLELATQSGEAPDIFTPDQEVKYFVDRKMVEPLNDKLSPEMKEFFGEENFAEGINMLDGEIYSLPNFGSVFRLIYNKDLLDKAGVDKIPETMDEVVAAAKMVSDQFKDEGVYGFAMNLKNPWGAMFRSMDIVAQKSGISEYNFKEGKYDFAAYRPVVLSFKEMFDNGSMFPGYESLDMDPLRAQFAQGNIAMYMSANWEIGVYDNQFPTEANWGAAPIPYVGDEPQGPGNIRGGYWQSIHADSEHKEAAWKVLEYFHQEEILTQYHEEALGLSIIPNVVESTQTPPQKGSEFFELSKYDAFWPAQPNTKGLTIEGKNAWDEFFAVLIGAEDIDETITKLNERYNKALDKAVDQEREIRYIYEDFDAKNLIK